MNRLNFVNFVNIFFAVRESDLCLSAEKSFQKNQLEFSQN